MLFLRRYQRRMLWGMLDARVNILFAGLENQLAGTAAAQRFGAGLVHCLYFPDTGLKKEFGYELFDRLIYFMRKTSIIDSHWLTIPHCDVNSGSFNF